MDQGQNFVKGTDPGQIEDLAAHGAIFGLQQLIAMQAADPVFGLPGKGMGKGRLFAHRKGAVLQH